jgi:hypothetical protein
MTIPWGPTFRTTLDLLGALASVSNSDIMPALHPWFYSSTFALPKYLMFRYSLLQSCLISQQLFAQSHNSPYLSHQVRPTDDKTGRDHISLLEPMSRCTRRRNT